MSLKNILLTLLLFTLITGCSSSFKLVDDDNQPVRNAIVISEISDYILQKWTVQIDVTNLEGEADILIGREAIYKKGFHPIVNNSDISGVFSATDFKFKPIILKGKVKLYPIREPAKYSYPIVSKQVDIEEIIKKENRINNTVNVSVEHCPGVKATYSTKDHLIRIESENQNLLESTRFFYEAASSPQKSSHLSGKEKIFFYCVNSDKSIYKTGISFKIRGGMRLNEEKMLSTYNLIIMKSKVDSVSAYIEPEIKPTRPLKDRYVLHKNRYPKVVLLKSKEKILRAIEDNIPTRTSEEKELKRLLLKVIK